MQQRLSHRQNPHESWATRYANPLLRIELLRFINSSSFSIFDVSAVKFYTLDDSVMFVLRRVSSRSTPMSSPPSARSHLKHTYSTGAISEGLVGAGGAVEVGAPGILIAPASPHLRPNFPIMRHITT